MKYLVSLLVFLSFSAFAHPQLGETIIHHGTAEGKGIKIKTWYAMYSVPRMMIRTETTVSGQQTEIEDEWIEETEIFNHGTAQQILTLCVALGGQLETVTLPLGSFASCKVQGQSLQLAGYAVPEILAAADIWLADLPVTGVVKAVGANFSIELSSYTWNQ
ncbi:MAG: hypothetical protein Fur0010_13940 [Bdellovibrio sp.]